MNWNHLKVAAYVSFVWMSIICLIEFIHSENWFWFSVEMLCILAAFLTPAPKYPAQ